MIKFGCVDLGLSIDQFFGLSWYEFFLLSERHEKQEKEKVLIQELEWLRIRKIWVLIINYMRDSKRTGPISETDLIRLSFDKVTNEGNNMEPIPPEEVERMFPKELNQKK